MYAKICVVLAVVACASAAPQLPRYQFQPQSRNAAILSQSQEVNPDGTFSYSFQSDDGISAEAAGGLKNAGRADLEAQTVNGRFSWTAPDGQAYQVQYVADENGYQPQGAHLPTPPPIPEAILRSLEFNARNPEPEERQTFQAQPFQAQPFQAQPFQAQQFQPQNFFQQRPFFSTTQRPFQFRG